MTIATVFFKHYQVHPMKPWYLLFSVFWILLWFSIDVLSFMAFSSMYFLWVIWMYNQVILTQGPQQHISEGSCLYSWGFPNSLIMVLIYGFNFYTYCFIENYKYFLGSWRWQLMRSLSPYICGHAWGFYLKPPDAREVHINYSWLRRNQV